MAQFYFDESRENDPYALPDAEVFEYDPDLDEAPMTDDEGNELEAGWYYWACFPGHLPDGPPIGPFETEAEAIADAREGSE